MTAEEAILMLDRIMYDEDNYGINWATGAKEAFNMAISALEKQISRKAIGEHYAHMRCPSCNHRIPSGQGSSSRRRDNWCNYCGQKILWSDEG